jgi:hypothetical protein
MSRGPVSDAVVLAVSTWLLESFNSCFDILALIQKYRKLALFLGGGNQPGPLRFRARLCFRGARLRITYGSDREKPCDKKHTAKKSH